MAIHRAPHPANPHPPKFSDSFLEEFRESRGTKQHNPPPEFSPSVIELPLVFRSLPGKATTLVDDPW